MKYPILHLDFPIPVTIGSGRVVIDNEGVMRLDLFSPEEQIVVMEKMAPIERAAPESPEHREGCCTNSDGTWSESDSCDAECWCHAPVPEHHEEPPTFDPRAAGTVYPSQPKAVEQPCDFTMPHPPHGFISPFARDGLNCPGIQPPDPVIEEQLEDRLDYDARGQNYTEIQADTNPWGKVVLTVCGTGKGDGCGVVVYDKEQHDLFHIKTRSRV
jgi:hypothetical protein